jgi:hypothetical protein
MRANELPEKQSRINAETRGTQRGETESWNDRGGGKQRGDEEE